MAEKNNPENRDTRPRDPSIVTDVEASFGPQGDGVVREETGRNHFDGMNKSQSKQAKTYEDSAELAPLPSQGDGAFAPIVGDSQRQPTREPVKISIEILKLLLVPLSIVGAFAAGIALLGFAQKYDWIESPSSSTSTVAVETGSAGSVTSFICPMMCVPPTSEPGRCSVCAMELVPATKGAMSGPSSSIEIDPRSRRVAGIKTTVATVQLLSREVKAVGEIRYDETQLKTLAAYIDGRIETLTADYTGIEVRKGESLGRLYSPDLYSAQAEYVKTLEFNENSNDTSARVRRANERLLESSRRRLLELGMTDRQIKRLESERVARRTLDLYAPISGTVIEKLASPGQYIQAGTPIYRLADLRKVWLVLELFPEDAMTIRLGQRVSATTSSLGNGVVEGTVEFVEPTVDPKMRTVGVRVVIDNGQGRLRPGEFAQATLRVPTSLSEGRPQETVVIPRNSLLSLGQTSLAYVETAPGQFQLRKIEVGPSANGMVAVLDGINAGENVVSKSTFLLDAQMQLQGNPSLIDPDKAVVDTNGLLSDAEQEEIRTAMGVLNAADRAIAEFQEICPVTEARLGSMGMGKPLKLELEGRTVFICCESCRKAWTRRPEKYFKILDDYLSKKRGGQDGLEKIQVDAGGLVPDSAPKKEQPKLDSASGERPPK